MNRAQMSSQERELRSKLNRIIASGEMVRGDLAIIYKKCTTADCGCHKGEQKHPSLYLRVGSGKGRKQYYIPKSRQEEAYQWLARYREAKEILKELSDIYIAKLREG